MSRALKTLMLLLSRAAPYVSPRRTTVKEGGRHGERKWPLAF